MAHQPFSAFAVEGHALTTAREEAADEASSQVLDIGVVIASLGLQTLCQIGLCLIDLCRLRVGHHARFSRR